MLQQNGIVDAVMTQDVDAIIFGAGLTLRDWSKEGKAKSNSSPTHVSVFDLERLKEISGGLDPEGMILVALLSGGDYDQDGVAGIGISLACEIARAGFGSDLIELVKAGDEQGISEWRERLQYELESNESGYFKTKRKSIKIPESFPNRQILEYYISPAVTEQSELKKLEEKWLATWKEEINLAVLRTYVAEMFDWKHKPGAWHFVRNMAPCLLANRLLNGAATSLIKSERQILERGWHLDNDGIPELRLVVVPAEVVGLNLDAEEDSPEYLEKLASAVDINNDNVQQEDGDENEAVPASPTKKRKTPPWSPWNPQKMWIAEALVEIGAREPAERWNQIQWEIQNDPKKFATRKCVKKKAAAPKSKAPGEPQAGAMRNYVVAMKSTSRPEEAIERSPDIAAKTIDDVLLSVDESLLPTPPRAKANTKKSRQPVPSTPTKSASNWPEKVKSPSMLEYFKSVKNGEVTRPRSGRIPLQSEAEGLEGTGTKLHGNPSVTSNERTDEHQDISAKSREATRISIAADHKPSESLRNVTQRSPARRKKKEVVPAEVVALSSSPVRIERFFNRTTKSVKETPLSRAGPPRAPDHRLNAVPQDPATGLSTTFPAAKRVQAVPRSSLPGTWKEIEYGSSQSSDQTTRAAVLRPSRVSIVDLTAD
jgi:hypothetical protein